jgi:hypothetical protein
MIGTVVLLLLDCHVQVAVDPLNLSKVLPVVLPETANANMLLTNLCSCLRQDNSLLAFSLKILKSNCAGSLRSCGSRKNFFQVFPFFAILFFLLGLLNVPDVEIFILVEVSSIEHTMTHINHMLSCRVC